jgi:hypothetical protein
MYVRANVQLVNSRPSQHKYSSKVGFKIFLYPASYAQMFYTASLCIIRVYDSEIVLTTSGWHMGISSFGGGRYHEQCGNSYTLIFAE